MLEKVMTDLLRLSFNQKLSESERRTCEKAHSILSDVLRMKSQLDAIEQEFRSQKMAMLAMFSL